MFCLYWGTGYLGNYTCPTHQMIYLRSAYLAENLSKIMDRMPSPKEAVVRAEN